MTSSHSRHLTVPTKITQCPNLSVVGYYECHHCGDHHGANNDLKMGIMRAIGGKMESNCISETRANTERAVPVDTVHTTVHQPFMQTVSLATTPVPSIELPKVKPRGRPRMSAATAPARANSLSKGTPVDTQWIEISKGPLSANRKRYVKPEPATAVAIRPAIQPDLLFNGPFRFLDLPQDIRHRVYLHALTDVGPLNKVEYHQHSITRLNRRIRHESLYLLYTLNPFKADHRDTCKSGPIFIKAIGDHNCSMIRHFSWYTTKRTLYLNIVPSANGYLSHAYGEGPEGEERAAEILAYVQQCCSTVGLRLAEFIHITQIVLRTTPREPRKQREPKKSKGSKDQKDPSIPTVV